MIHEHKQAQRIWGGVFLALALSLYALVYLGSTSKQPAAERFRESMGRLFVNPEMVQSLPAKLPIHSPAVEIVGQVINPPAFCLLFVGVAWFWNGRKKVGIGAYGILAGYFILLSAIPLGAAYLARGNQNIKSSYLLTVALVGLSLLGAGVLFIWRARKLAAQVAEPGAGGLPEADKSVAAAAVPAAPRSVRARPQAYAACNILQTSSAVRQLWHFDVRGREFKLSREQTMRDGEPLPSHLVGKSWGALFQPKLNVAWLPAQNVFLRVAQFPQASAEETRTMVELQLERLSPIPVTQAVWTLHVLPHASGNMQTVIVTLVERSVVEEYLGVLEGQGFLADRLDVPMLDQLQSVSAKEDGAWVYPEAQGGNNTVLVAWWYGGVLQTVDYLTLPEGKDRAASLKDQLVQMSWAGELDGWLTGPPTWHLVAEAAVAADWEPPLRQGLDRPVEVVAPLPAAELAALTARRSAQAEVQNNLLPAEFAARYRQQFVDRLWMRGLGAVLAMYVVCVLIYFIAVGFLGMQTRKVESQLALAGPGYTNTLATISRYGILKDREDLKFAALDCWQSVAKLLPDGVVLDTLTFNGGTKLQIGGTAPASQVNDVIVFCGQLGKERSGDPPQPLFKSGGGAVPSIIANSGGGTVRWNFALELKRGELQ